MNNKLNNDKDIIKIITEIKNGNINVFEEIIKKYEKLVFSIAFKLIGNYDEAMDLTQEVFLRVFKFIDKYNLEYKFSTWIVKITINLYKDKVKLKKRNLTVNLQSLISEEEENKKYDEQFVEKSKPDEIAENKIKSEKIWEIVNQLPKNYKIVIILYFWNEYSYEEIAQVLELPIGTVKSRIKRAKIYLVEKYSNVLLQWM